MTLPMSTTSLTAIRARLDGGYELSRLDTALLLDEVDRLRNLLSDASRFLTRARVDLGATHNRLFDLAAVKLLAQHEWVVDGRECTSYCLHCRNPESKGHDVDCEAFGTHGLIRPTLKQDATFIARFDKMMREIDGTES